jgi:hypothetical protein
MQGVCGRKTHCRIFLKNKRANSQNRTTAKIKFFFFSFSEEKKKQKEELFRCPESFAVCGRRLRALP